MSWAKATVVTEATIKANTEVNNLFILRTEWRVNGSASLRRQHEIISG
jgi:hypothetical protein